MEKKDEKKLREHTKRNPSRRKQTRERRRFLGDRRSNKPKPAIEEPPAQFDLNVHPADDWHLEVRKLNPKKKSS